ncbi:MAG: phage terminase small subunit P27 family [Actinomycetota bacterium]|nr:phage terminase small subunit P27 family [Actinomycetota bacterium]
MKGRKPLPDNVVNLRGNPGHKPKDLNHPKPDPVAPTCPRWLSHRAKYEWKRIVPELENLGLLTKIDRAALAGYCENLALVAIATEVISAHYKKYKKLTYEYENKNGAINEIPIPEIKIAREAWLLVHRFEVEFGMTPSSRTRIDLPEAKNTGEFERWLNGEGEGE